MSHNIIQPLSTLQSKLLCPYCNKVGAPVSPFPAGETVSIHDHLSHHTLQATTRTRLWYGSISGDTRRSQINHLEVWTASAQIAQGLHNIYDEVDGVSQRQLVIADFFQRLGQLFAMSHKKLSNLPVSVEVLEFVERMPNFEVLAVRGLEALQKVLGYPANHWPKSDMEVYALLHVAYACIPYTYLQPIETICEELYNNAFAWSTVLGLREQFALTAIIRQLWNPELTQTGAYSQKNSAGSTDQMMGGINKSSVLPLESIHTSKPLRTNSATYCTSPVASTQDSSEFLNNLRTSIVIRVCKPFLDGMYPFNCTAYLQ